MVYTPYIPKRKTHPLSIPTNLTSEVFNNDNPPKDWADFGVLVFHEALRREMSMMNDSILAMPDSPNESESWKITLFAKWFTSCFIFWIQTHHGTEEKLYFREKVFLPWTGTRAGHAGEAFSSQYEELTGLLETMKDACDQILKRNGKQCEEQVATLKRAAPDFDQAMRAHFKEEEELVPEILRKKYKKPHTLNERKLKQKMIKSHTRGKMRTFYGSLVMTLQDIATEEEYNNIMKKGPILIRHLGCAYYLPNYDNVIVPMRDAPTYTNEPNLDRVRCFGIPLFFPNVK